MRTNRIVLIVILATLAIYSACRKLDMSSKDATTESIKQKEERFFNTSTAIPLQVQALSEYMKRENFRVGFVNKTVNQIGYPRWDKSLIYSGKRQGPGGRGSTGDSVSLVYIPFVRDSQQYVNASLIIKTTPTDTVYKYLCDWQYKDLGFDTTGTNWNAFDAFLVFATLDKNVFNRNRFVIKDSNLLNPVVSSLLSSAGKKFDSTKIVYTLQPIQGAGRGSDYWDINTICYQIGACIESTTVRGATVGSCPSNSFWVEWTECYDTWVWIETGGGSGGSGNGNGNGGSGTGGGGSGSGSGGGTPPECDPIAVKGMNVVPECEPGWVPVLDDPAPYVCNYVLTTHEQNVFNILNNEDDQSDQISQNLDCKGTKRTGNINFNGTKEHWMIQLDYVSRNPLHGEVEFAVPQSSATGNRGYADMVNLLNGDIFEIKSETDPMGIPNGTIEVERYVSKANLFCNNTLPFGVLWHKGASYPVTLLPSGNPNSYLEARLSVNGVITYKYINYTNPVPLPLSIPQSIIEKFKNLIERLKDNLANADKIIAEFLQQNPEVLVFIKTACVGVGVAIVVGTILEDIATGGLGILDDWVSFKLAFRIIRFGLAL